MAHKNVKIMTQKTPPEFTSGRGYQEQPFQGPASFIYCFPLLFPLTVSRGGHDKNIAFRELIRKLFAHFL